MFFSLYHFFKLTFDTKSKKKSWKFSIFLGWICNNGRLHKKKYLKNMPDKVEFLVSLMSANTFFLNKQKKKKNKQTNLSFCLWLNDVWLWHYYDVITMMNYHQTLFFLTCIYFLSYEPFVCHYNVNKADVFKQFSKLYALTLLHYSNKINNSFFVQRN